MSLDTLLDNNTIRHNSAQSRRPSHCDAACHTPCYIVTPPVTVQTTLSRCLLRSLRCLSECHTACNALTPPVNVTQSTCFHSCSACHTAFVKIQVRAPSRVEGFFFFCFLFFFSPIFFLCGGGGAPGQHGDQGVF